jgi:SAM-dependent methyltransferase
VEFRYHHAAMRHEIVIQQDNASGGVTYWQARDHQSLADRRGISLAAYIHAMYGLLRQAGAANVLLIGCGGGTLATMLAKARVQVAIVDIDPLSFALARRYFHLPNTVACHVADGADYLHSDPTRYDAIVLDAYADGRVPRHLASTAFFALAKSRLRRGGLFLMNMIMTDDEDPAPDRVGGRVARALGRVRILDAEGEVDRNAVIAAGRIGRLQPPPLMLKPIHGAAALAAELKTFAFRSLKPI